MNPDIDPENYGQLNVEQSDVSLYDVTRAIAFTAMLPLVGKTTKNTDSNFSGRSPVSGWNVSSGGITDTSRRRRK